MPSPAPTNTNSQFLGLQAQLQQLPQEKEDALAQAQKRYNQQVVNTVLLQRTAAELQNTANTSAAHQAQWSSSVSSQLDNITKILNTNFTGTDKVLENLFYNQNLIYNTMESFHQKSEQRFATIEGQLARLGMNSQAPIVQSPQPHRVQYQAVPLL